MPPTLPLSDTARTFLDRPDTVVTPEGVYIVRNVIDGRPVFFAIRNLMDKIQHKIAKGGFYEPKELRIIRDHYPADPKGTFVDIGANIGNHSIYALKMLGAPRSIVFEPNPGAYELLILNIILNDLHGRVVFDHLGYGLSAEAEDGLHMRIAPRNLGATKLLRKGTEGDISVRPGDDFLDGVAVDFIKLDVEGMEIDALNGLKRTVATQRPPVFLECDHANRPALDAWMADVGYRLAVTGRQFETNGNLLLLPD